MARACTRPGQSPTLGVHGFWQLEKYGPGEWVLDVRDGSLGLIKGRVVFRFPGLEVV